MKRIYISGPISGTSDYLERFAKAEEAIKSNGDFAVNPAAVNDRLPNCTSYNCYIDMSLAMLRHCDAIYMMHGWQNSRGARLEKAYAEALDIPVLYEEKSDERCIE